MGGPLGWRSLNAVAASGSKSSEGKRRFQEVHTIMNSKLVRITFTALFAGLLASLVARAQTPPAQAASAPAPVPLNVEVVKPPADKGKPAAPTPAAAEDRMLLIAVKNPLGQPASLEVKYWLMMKDVQDHSISVGVNESSTVTLPPYAGQIVTSSVTKSDYKPRSGQGKAKAASGSKYYGYGVQVLEDGKIAAQTYDPIDVKTTINAAK
jgi:hypothetical protein